MTMSETFAAAAFAQALLDPEAPPPCGLAQRRFAVYRNNVVVSLVDALADRFPTVLKLVGEEFFRAMARIYVRREPPTAPMLAEYGAGFPPFIETFAPAQELPYLADAARLDCAIGRAHDAAEATPLALEEIAAFPQDQVEGARIALHPSLRLVASRFSVVSIWRLNALDASADALDLQSAQDALVLRPDLRVEVRELPAGGLAFARALRDGASVAEAATSAGEAADAFDLSTALGVLFAARAIVAMHPGS